MTKPYTMRQAAPNDLDAVTAILEERITWLRQRGSDQWNTGLTFRNRMANSIAEGDTWTLEDETTPIATITISRSGDPDFWTPAELAAPVLYVAKMASRINRSGERLGELMLRWVQDRAARLGLQHVRWDVWRTNHDLQKYYKSLGAEFIRTVDVADRWSGALFELPAIRRDDLAGELTTSPWTRRRPSLPAASDSADRNR